MGLHQSNRAMLDHLYAAIEDQAREAHETASAYAADGATFSAQENRIAANVLGRLAVSCRGAAAALGKDEAAANAKLNRGGERG